MSAQAPNVAESKSVKDTSSNLKALLDSIWQAEPGSTLAVQNIATQLNKAGWCILAAWDSSASLGSPGGSVRIGQHCTIQLFDSAGLLTTVLALREGPKPADQSYIIAYSGSPYYLVVERSIGGLGEPRTHDPVKLVSAMQFIRDHLDSLLLLPFEMRQRRLRHAAESVGIAEEDFRELAIWFGVISSLV